MAFVPPRYRPRTNATSRCWLAVLADPLSTAKRLADLGTLRYGALDERDGAAYLEFDRAVRHHYIETACMGNLVRATAKPVDMPRDEARRAIHNPSWDFGRWFAGGQGARVDKLPWYAVGLGEDGADNPRTPIVPSYPRD